MQKLVQVQLLQSYISSCIATMNDAITICLSNTQEDKYDYIINRMDSYKKITTNLNNQELIERCIANNFNNIPYLLLTEFKKDFIQRIVHLFGEDECFKTQRKNLINLLNSLILIYEI
jgi:hypothetical protein